MARPLKEIDQKYFENLCALQCTENEICAFFEITDKTLTSWCKRTYGESFSEVYKKKREKGKISLRRAQMRLAEKNAAMAIWLGKNILGQKDSMDVNVTAQEGIALDELEKMVRDADENRSGANTD